MTDGNEIVYYGITKDFVKRCKEHEKSNQKFTKTCIVKGPMYRENAEEEERGLIFAYQSTHKGRPPRYNVSKSAEYLSL